MDTTVVPPPGRAAARDYYIHGMQASVTARYPSTLIQNQHTRISPRPGPGLRSSPR